ncbi:MAG: phosphatase PAP2 family protein [Proteobacteria bacterium]|nr:phosphatase PAP2 family protein [Pseudomonadota bacterium]
MRNVLSKEKLLEFVIPLSLLVVFTSTALVTDLDLWISHCFYDAAQKKWVLEDSIFVTFVYDFGPLATVAIFLWSLIKLVLSYVVPSQFHVRAKSYLIIISIFLVPVFLTHAVVKDAWKRPRPRDTVEFGGNHRFHRVLEVADGEFQGKSFPSGHSAAGFILVFGYFLLKGKSRARSSISLFGAILFGCWLSFARIAAGGHYLSDTVWSFGLCWFSVFLLFYYWYLPYNHRLALRTPFRFSKKRLYVVAAILMAVLTVAVGLRYNTVQYYERIEPRSIDIPPKTADIEFKVRVRKGNIHIRPEKRSDIAVTTWAVGSGFSNLRVRRKLEVERSGGTLKVEVATFPSTLLFWGYQSHTTIHVPFEAEVRWDVETKLGKVFRYPYQ